MYIKIIFLSPGGFHAGELINLLFISFLAPQEEAGGDGGEAE